MSDHSTLSRLRVGITIGDINSISHELIFKTFSDHAMYQVCIPVVYGNNKVWAFHRKLCGNPEVHYQPVLLPGSYVEKKINLINCWEEEVKIEPGPANFFTGKYALKSLNRALQDLKAGLIDVLVTLPVDKNAVAIHEPSFKGHTDYIASFFNVQKPLMIMISDLLKVACVTVHTPLRQVAALLNQEMIKATIRKAIDSMKYDFGIIKPRIAVLGLNPHAGEGGLLGHEEKEIIAPAIHSFAEQAIVLGPYSADGFFGKALFRKFDLTIAMYHDQGLIAFKTLFPQEGVNYTAGLPVVRTAPAHGTGADIAGKNKADEHSFRNAIYKAIDIYKSRQRIAESMAQPLKISALTDDKGE
jgi:4-hydroxythreonine-4-phosphate dehydrogenase